MTTSLSNANEAPTTSGFAALNLTEPVLRAIEAVGYTEPTPVQAATYPIAITGRDIIVQARTGTGKTAAFGIPLVDKLVSGEPRLQALVLAPTRELAVQSQREIARLGQLRGLHTVAIYGGAPMGRQIDELRSGAQIVSGTPGRVLDHLRRGTLDPSHLKVLVLDEMDEMLSMGFAKELNAILELIPPRGRRQTMCFSATVDGEIRRHAERHMHEPEMISLSSDAVAAEQITHQVYMVSGRDRIGDLVRVLEVEDPESAIIFCNMRSETERVAMGLKQAGFNADWLNGDLPQRDRERIMASTREGKLRYLVATDVAARGIDISHLTHVINFTFPESGAVYVHRTGRTGRAGRTGCAVSLVGPEELGRLYYLRLEYKISPVERSLPTSGELKTRQEIDRIGLLEGAFLDRPNPTDLAVARRLLTHPESERILAGLLHTFFGTREDVDDEAAAARRSKLAPNLERAPQSARAQRDRERPRRDREHEPDRERPRRDRDREREPDRERDRPRERGRDRDRQRSRDRGRAQDRDRSQDRDRDRAQDQDRDRAQDQDRDRDRAQDQDLAQDQSMTQDSDRAQGRDRDRTRDRGPGRERDRAKPRHGAQAQWSGDPSQDLASVPPASEAGEAAETARHDSDETTATERESKRPRGERRDKTGAAPARRRRGRDRAASRLAGQNDEIDEKDHTRLDAQAGDQEPAASPQPSDEREATGSAQDSKPPKREPRRARGRSPRSSPPASVPAATDGELLPTETADADAALGGADTASAELEGLLYLNLGKRDGLRVPEVARLLQDNCELARAEIGRIRVRDRYTFVDVPEERLDAIISSLSGQVLHDKALAPERAKTAKN